jgi:hypothetical protein
MYFERAERDLAEATSIAERGSMLIWQIDLALERAALLLILADADSDPHDVIASKGRHEYLQQATQKINTARMLTLRTERPYEPHIPDSVDWIPPRYITVFKAGSIVGFHRRIQRAAILALAIGQSGGPSVEIGLSHIADELLNHGNLVDAAHLLEWGITLCKRTCDLRNALGLFMARARLRVVQKSYDHARWDYKKVLDLCKEVGDAATFFDGEYELATLEFRSGLLLDAHDHLSHLRDHLPKDGNADRIAAVQTLLTQFPPEIVFNRDNPSRK